MIIGICSVMALAAGTLVCGLTDAFQSLMWLWLLPVTALGSFLCLGGLFFLFLWLMCARVNMEELPEQDSKFYRTLATLTIEAVLAVLQMRVHTKGLEKTPKDGRFLLVCNHINDMDPVTLLWFFRKSQLAFISMRENDTMFLVGPLMRKLLCQLHHLRHTIRIGQQRA